MKIKTSELTGPALDWAALVATGGDKYALQRMLEMAMRMKSPVDVLGGFHPSTDWSQGGPLIEARCVGFSYISDQWLATADETSVGCGATEQGPNHLIAAMRAIVAAELGDEVDIPEELAA